MLKYALRQKSYMCIFTIMHFFLNDIFTSNLFLFWSHYMYLYVFVLF